MLAPFFDAGRDNLRLICGYQAGFTNKTKNVKEGYLLSP